MKTYKNLFPYICNERNAEIAYFKASYCRHTMKEFLEIEFDRYANLAYLLDSISNMTYCVGEYTSFTIYEPKRRDILKLPPIDRIAQHMWYGVIDYYINPRLYEHSYACRTGKGLHLSSEILHNWIYKECVINAKQMWAIKADISSYFKSIDHNILKNKFQYYISDDKVIWLTNVLIDNNGPLPNGVGIPVGNLSSQIFANIYGQLLDDFVKHQLHCKYYMRYMDDFIILSDNYHELEMVLYEISQFVIEEMKMTLNPSTTIVYIPNGVDFVGFKHYPEYTVPRKTSYKRLQRFVSQFINGNVDEIDFYRSFPSMIGHLIHSDSKEFLIRLLEMIRLSKGDETVINMPGYNKFMNSLGIKHCSNNDYYVEYPSNPLFDNIPIYI